MSKLIKVHDDVKDELTRLAGPGETYNNTIEHLLIARRRLLETLNTLEPYLKINKWREDRFHQLTAAPAPEPAAGQPSPRTLSMIIECFVCREEVSITFVSLGPERPGVWTGKCPKCASINTRTNLGS